jgi:putative heme-binding domain-containing protein
MALVFVLLGSPSRPGQAQPPPVVATTEPQSPQDELKTFRLPPGFEAQLVAAEPDLQKPMNLAFDAKGRLWVTGSVEYPFAVKDTSKGRDTLKILEDFDATGRARKITTFAADLNIPIGVLPLRDNAAIVFSIPYIYLLKDTDGDGKADERTVVFSGFGQADTHGLNNAFTHWLDGWVYACHGFNNTSRVKGKDGHEVAMNSGNTYRFRIDGSRIEQFTFGQVNPFGLSFDAHGDLFSADCHSRPLMMLLRGSYYPSFTKPHDGLGFGPEICPHDHGSTGLAGVCVYDADHFPAAYRGRTFIGNVITNRINQDTLEYQGSSPRAKEQQDFLSSSDPWFRPVDIKLGPDGALYVADFYNRIIGHYEAPLTHPGRDRERGRIWRIVYRGPKGEDASPPPPRNWTKATDEDILQALGDGNIAVRTLATHEAVARGPRLTEALAKLAGDFKRPLAAVHALWALDRLGKLDDALLLAAAKGPEIVQVHALRVLAERPQLTADTKRFLLDSLKATAPRVQRAAADALSTRADPEHLKPLLDRRLSVPTGDPQLLHMTRIALRNQLRQEASWKEAALILETDRKYARSLADAALGVRNESSASFLLTYLHTYAGVNEDVAATVHHVARYSRGNVSARLAAWVQLYADKDSLRKVSLLRAVHQGTAEKGLALSEEAMQTAHWLVLQLVMNNTRGPEVTAGCELARDLNLLGHNFGDVERLLYHVLLSETRPDAARRAAALLKHKPNSYAILAPVGQILNNSAEPMGLREACAQALEGNRTVDAVTFLGRSLPAAPERLQRMIAASLASTPAGAKALLDAVESGKASARLLQDQAIVTRVLASNLPKANERIAALTQDLPSVDAKLRKLAAKRLQSFAMAKPDAALGAKLFEKHCAACHQVAGHGGKVGPQLDGIGSRGPERLLEDLFDPSRNLDKAFQTTLLETKEGKLIQGLFLREEGELLVLADETGKEVMLPKSRIRQRKQIPVSPMPANLGTDLNEAETNHLLGYLLRLRN